MNHVGYPHEPGTLYGCLACETECACNELHTRCLAHAMDYGEYPEPWMAPHAALPSALATDESVPAVSRSAALRRHPAAR